MADLGSMTEAQREAHYLAVCKAIDIPSEPRLLDFIWMNHDQGPRSMVLYARRGAAEVLRQRRGISVTETQQVEANGYIMFTVKGVDSTGRIESAVGASAIKDLKGERLAYAIMTAHTRATRRLTLQFVGHGILDESEVNAPTADLSTSPAALASLAGSPAVFPPPQVPATSAPGKDITIKLPDNPTFKADTTSAKTSAIPKHSVSQNPPNEGVTVKTICKCGPNECCARCQHVGGAGGDKDKSGKYLPGLGPNPLDKLPEGVFSENPPFDAGGPPNVKSTIVDLNPDKVSDTVPKVKRTRKKRNTVDLASPGQVSPNADIPQSQRATTPAVGYNVIPQDIIDAGNSLASGMIKGLQDEVAASEKKSLAQHQAEQQALRDAATERLRAVQPNLALPKRVRPLGPELQVQSTAMIEQPHIDLPEPKKTKDVPAIAPEKLADYRARLAKFSQDILPKAGMMPSDGIGGVTMKLRKFATVHTGADTNKLTEEQWTDLLNFLDVQSKDPAALVAYINKAIGVAQ